MGTIVADEREKALPPAILQRLRKTFGEFGREEGITRALTLLSLPYERPITQPEVFALYRETVEDLTAERVITALARAQMEEGKFFPPPARLRELAGMEKPGQCSERLAREALQWVMWRIRNHGVEGMPKRGKSLGVTNHRLRPLEMEGKLPREREMSENEADTLRRAAQEEQFEWIPCPVTPGPVRRALEEFGEGDVEAGVQLIALHPMLSKSRLDGVYLGLVVSAIEKLEARWHDAWVRANGFWITEWK
jgi:hypothetical protein